MDCIHCKVREGGRILSRTAYVVLGVTTNRETNRQQKTVIFDSEILHIEFLSRELGFP
jgi:transposase-like protein